MNERRARILTLVTEAYISSVHPVASAPIAEQLDLSSATVRNEFAALEIEGYLMQPHTSAGRVPTAQGFASYALRFIPPRPLSTRLRRRLLRSLDDARSEGLLKRIATAAAELSGYAVVVSLPSDGTLHALEVHLSLLSSRKLLAVVVLENGMVRQLLVDLDPAPTDAVIDDAERNLRQLTLPLGELPRALELIATRTEGDMARTLRALAAAWPSLTPPRAASDGLRHLLAEPESNDPDFVRLIVERVDASDPGPIGDPPPLSVELDESVASVSARLDLGAASGLLTVIGPARMRYPHALMVARGVSDAVAGSLAEDRGSA
jgi:heat-inducible transcriptional repressor